MMRSTFQLLLHLWVGATLCAGRAVPEWVPSPQTVDCDISDDGCECATFAHETSYTCGYVDPDWVHGWTAKKRSLDSATPRLEASNRHHERDGVTAGDTRIEVLNPNLLPDDHIVTRRSPDPQTDEFSDFYNSTETGDLKAIGEVRDRKNPSPAIPLRAQQPIITALTLLGVDALATARNVVLNRTPDSTRNKYVNGIKGNLAVSTKIGATTYAAGARWVLRWDFAWNAEFAKITTLPTTALVGAHVKLQVQDEYNLQRWAIYFNTDSFYYSRSLRWGDEYFNDVVSVLTETVEYKGLQDEDWFKNQSANAKKLAARWIQLMQPFITK